jgi:ABC-type multidrug transport system fused ATPase/permease subunit
MPPMRVAVFKKQGSQDDDAAIVVKGNEAWRTISFFRYPWAMIVGVIFTIAQGGSPFLMNIVMSDMMNVMTQDAMSDFVDFVVDLCLKFVAVVCGMAVITALSIGIRVWMNPIFMTDLRDATYRAVLDLDIEFFDANPTGTLVSRLSEDVTLIRETYIDKGYSIIQSLSQALIGIIIAMSTVWRVTLACLPAVPLAAATYMLGEFLVERQWYRFHDESTATGAKAEEVITQFRTVKAFDCELHEAQMYANGLHNVHDIYKDTSWIHGIKDGLITFYTWAMIAGMMYYTLWLIIRRPYIGLEPGDMMTLMMALMMGTMGISQGLSMVEDFKKAGLSAAKLLFLIESRPKVDRHEGAHTINGEENVRGSVEFRDVGFRYATQSDWAVRHLSFTIQAGQTVAFVGESGCGKSTTLQLMQRFYEIQEGEILIDGVDIKTLAPEFVREQISIVPQGPVLFSLSICDNVRYAKPKAAEDEVAKAAQTGNAHDFIMQLPDNYKTIVQQTSLSGGQKQRICISRAILQNTPIMLLDEATAALDTQSEQLVQQSLEQVRHGKTAILVAHRLATVINADVIFVFKDGHVVETGKHMELLQQEGLYADLVKFQLQ